MNKDLAHYASQWDLRNACLLADTQTSQIYRVGYRNSTAILKLLTPTGKRDESGAAVALQYFSGAGAVKLLRHDDNAQLLEYVAGDDLTGLVKRGEDRKATEIIAEVLNRLHNIDNGAIPDGLTSLRHRFNALFQKSVQDSRAGSESIFVRAASVAHRLLDEPLDQCVLHGDIRHGNIKYQPQRGWLALDPKGLIGERSYDAANIFCNPWDMPDLVAYEARILDTASLLAQRLNVTVTRLLAFAYIHACLSASWCLQDGENPDLPLNVAGIIESHVR